MPFTPFRTFFILDDASIQCVHSVDMSFEDVRARSRYAFAVVLDTTTYLKGVEALSRPLAYNGTETYVNCRQPGYPVARPCPM